MNDTQVIQILLSLIERKSLTAEENEAIKHCIGVLSWTSLRQGALKRIREKKSKPG